MEKKSNGFISFLKRKDIDLKPRRYFIDALGSMAMGLFASLLISTIFSTIADKLNISWLATAASYVKLASGPAMAIAIGMALNAPSLVLLSLCAVGISANELGGPLGTWFAVCIACEFGKLVSKETKIDIIVTPTVTILLGVAISVAIGPAINLVMLGFGKLIMKATVLQPFWMGIVVSVIVGMLLTLPISSAAICATLGLVGLAGGAATAGCCAQMVGFAFMSFRENKWGGLAAQGLGTSMRQMGNIVKNPIVWLPPTITAAITGPIATCLFKMENGTAVASGMGTCGLVGPIGVVTAETFGGAFDWIGMLLICIILPAVITPIIAIPFRKAGLIKDGDLKLDL